MTLIAATRFAHRSDTLDEGMPAALDTVGASEVTETDSTEIAAADSGDGETVGDATVTSLGSTAGALRLSVVGPACGVDVLEHAASASSAATSPRRIASPSSRHDNVADGRSTEPHANCQSQRADVVVGRRGRFCVQGSVEASASSPSATPNGDSVANAVPDGIAEFQLRFEVMCLAARCVAGVGLGVFTSASLAP